MAISATTLNHLPQSGSLALDAGNAIVCADINYDQRGETRISGDQCDIGAVEATEIGQSTSCNNNNCSSVDDDNKCAVFNTIASLKQLGIEATIFVAASDDGMLTAILQDASYWKGKSPQNISKKGSHK
ncbi:MAG: hypothetical protein IMF12_11195 [Proteobacteria bacterium]|nr:hypothetical protein [Pseudomonadota bacterium]